MIREISGRRLQPLRFIEEQIAAIREAVGGEAAINALSGGVDSSVVTMLGHRALGRRLKTVFIDNGLMRAGEPSVWWGFSAGSAFRSHWSTPGASSSPPSAGSPTPRKNARP